MNRQAERILQRAKKAGLKKSRRLAHPLSEDELSELKIQILSNPLRSVLAVSGAFSALAAWIFLEMGMPAIGAACAVTAVVLFAFAIFGIRRTLDSVDFGGAIIEAVSDFLSDVY